MHDKSLMQRTKEHLRIAMKKMYSFTDDRELNSRIRKMENNFNRNLGQEGCQYKVVNNYNTF